MLTIIVVIAGLTVIGYGAWRWAKGMNKLH